MKKASHEEIEGIIQWVNCMMHNPVDKKDFAKWVNDAARA